MYRCYSVDRLKKLAVKYPGLVGTVDIQKWVDDRRNVQLVDGKDVGLATFEYPGVYNVHWFFVSKGRDAITQARSMLRELFKTTDAQTIRGLTPSGNKAARWASRQVGMTSYGEKTFEDGETYELFFMTRQEFYKGKNHG